MQIFLTFRIDRNRLATVAHRECCKYLARPRFFGHFCIHVIGLETWIHLKRCGDDKEQQKKNIFLYNCICLANEGREAKFLLFFPRCYNSLTIFVVMCQILIGIIWGGPRNILCISKQISCQIKNCWIWPAATPNGSYVGVRVKKYIFLHSRHIVYNP